MRAQNHVEVLRQRVGYDGHDDLEEMMRASQKHLLTVDHFERRFTEMRLEMSQADAALRFEIAALRQDVLAGRFDLLKWSFVFWVGQAVTIAAIVGAMLRFMQS